MSSSNASGELIDQAGVSDLVIIGSKKPPESHPNGADQHSDYTNTKDSSDAENKNPDDRSDEDPDNYHYGKEIRFTLFSALPLELRRKIWNFALPGPRVVRYDFRGIYQYKSRVKLVCQLMNTNIADIAQVSREARKEVERRFSKIPVPFASRREVVGLPFVFIDYLVDTLYVETKWHSDFDVTQHFGKVRKLAVSACELVQSVHAKYLDTFEPAMLKDLQHLILVIHPDMTLEDFEVDWALVEIDLLQHCPVVWPADAWIGYEHYERPDLTLLRGRYGNLAFDCAQAIWKTESLSGAVHTSPDRASETSFVLPPEEFPDWDGVSLSFALPLVKKPSSSQWYLKYFIHDRDLHEQGLDEDDDEDNDIDEEAHHHLEPIRRLEGTLQSCSPVEEDDENVPNCEHCSKRRWVEGLDMFWGLDNGHDSQGNLDQGDDE